VEESPASHYSRRGVPCSRADGGSRWSYPHCPPAVKARRSAPRSFGRWRWRREDLARDHVREAEEHTVTRWRAGCHCSFEPQRSHDRRCDADGADQLNRRREDTSARASKAPCSAGNDAAARHAVREPRPRDGCARLRSYLGRPRATLTAASRVLGRQASASPLRRASPSWRVYARHKPATRPERRLRACVVVLEAWGMVGVEPGEDRVWVLEEWVPSVVGPHP